MFELYTCQRQPNWGTVLSQIPIMCPIEVADNCSVIIVHNAELCSQKSCLYFCACHIVCPFACRIKTQLCDTNLLLFLSPFPLLLQPFLTSLLPPSVHNTPIHLRLHPCRQTHVCRRSYEGVAPCGEGFAPHK